MNFICSTKRNYFSGLEFGERSFEAPAYSHLTPLIDQKRLDDSVLSLPSPLPPMSPATNKIYNMLLGTEIFDSDDSVKDPHYNIDQEDSSDDTSFDEDGAYNPPSTIQSVNNEHAINKQNDENTMQSISAEQNVDDCKEQDNVSVSLLNLEEELNDSKDNDGNIPKKRKRRNPLKLES